MGLSQDQSSWIEIGILAACVPQKRLRQRHTTLLTKVSDNGPGFSSFLCTALRSLRGQPAYETEYRRFLDDELDDLDSSGFADDRGLCELPDVSDPLPTATA